MLSACVQSPVKLPSRAEAEQFVKDYQKATKQAMNAKVVREFREIFPTKMITLSSYRVPSVKQSLVVETSLYVHLHAARRESPKPGALLGGMVTRHNFYVQCTECSTANRNSSS
jgi:hypothetical protein